MDDRPKAARRFDGIVVAHAAVNGGMLTNFGGRIARKLVAEGAEMHFFASRYFVFGQSAPSAEFRAMGGVYHPLPLPQYLAPGRELWSMLRMAAALRRHRVEVLHTRGSVMGLVGRVAGRLAGVPVVVHHLDDLLCRDARLGPWSRACVARLEVALSRLGNGSFFVSQAVLDDALAIGFDAKTSWLVGHDLNEVFESPIGRDDPRVEAMRRRLDRVGVPRDAHIIGCLARLTQIKGIDILLEAASLLGSDTGWVFVVKGDGPLRDALRAAIVDMHLDKTVFMFHDEMATEDLPALYRCFDLFTLPTRREGFGMVFAEAMAMGVPVVGPRMAPITEVVPDGCGVLVEPEDPAALAIALKLLIADDAERARMAARGQAHARGTWMNAAAAAERVLAEYVRLLATRRGARQGRHSTSTIVLTKRWED